MSPLMSVVVLPDTIKCNYAVWHAQSQTDIYSICIEFNCGWQKRVALDAYLHLICRRVQNSLLYFSASMEKNIEKSLLLVSSWLIVVA